MISTRTAAAHTERVSCVCSPAVPFLNIFHDRLNLIWFSNRIYSHPDALTYKLQNNTKHDINSSSSGVHVFILCTQINHPTHTRERDSRFILYYALLLSWAHSQHTANFELNLFLSCVKRTFLDFCLVKVCFSLIFIEICDCHAYRFELLQMITLEQGCWASCLRCYQFLFLHGVI